LELWFTEQHSRDVRFSVKTDRQLYSGQSEFQRIDIFESEELGRILVLDGFLMVTEKDEYIYHEMITHVAMAANPEIENVLVIGAGDGGTVRELTRYPNIKHIDLAEIDREVVRVCREYIPQTASCLSDPRVAIYYEDGLKFVRTRQGVYDLILVDSTDPFGPGEGLFTKEFYGNCYKALGDRGILVNQHESVFYDEYAQSMKRAHKRLSELFPVALVYQAHIPTYPSGHWLFGFASKGINPLDIDADAWNALGIKTKYYNTHLHLGAFAIPNTVIETLN
jgi:spermidine synthase